jgi:cellulose synthase/poly-beta-1,6-N-acetylglucosamine synthase-like glycosyltransferase/ketosteroid isomerase-like protein
MGPSRPIDAIVLLLQHQSLAFALSWAATYAAGHRLRRSHWLFSLAYVAVLEGAAWWILTSLTASAPSVAGCAAIALVVVLVVATTEHWNAIGQAAFASTLTLSGLFLIYVVYVTATSHLGPLSLLFSLLLLALQCFTLLLLAASTYEILDVVCRTRWRRKLDPAPVPGYAPRVSIHVPAYNEPPEMVKETLDALAALDYPNYEVIVIDDNTTDQKLWRPVEEHCRKLGFRFYHLENWPGFKSGALNYALRQTDPAAEIVGVVDSDYVVSPDWLPDCVGAFQDAKTAFVQSPQDYRDVRPGDRYAAACYNAYLFFFAVSMASRNEHNGIIFAGTMGLVRRSVLEEVGGWNEWCITEDAELSLRILERGYEGRYVDRSFGRGLMPLNFEGLKKQRFRWAFGGMQILRLHAKALLLGRRHSRAWRADATPGGVRPGLTWAQRWDYLVGGLQWLNDPATFGFTILLLLGTISLLVARSLFVQPLAGAVLFVPLLFVFMGGTRFLWALRRRIGCTLYEAAGAFTILLGLTWVVTLACVLGLSKREGVFLRTPKKRTGTDPWHAFRIVSQETALAVICFVAAGALGFRLAFAPYAWLMVGLLLWQGVIYSSAPRASLWSVESEAHLLHPEYLGATRTTGRRFSSMVTDRRAVRWLRIGAATAAALFVLAIVLAPEEERAFRTNPNREPLLAHQLTSAAPEAAAKAIVYLEGRAALHQQVDEAVRLWDANGVIRDANYTLADTLDDHVWVGQDAIRERYRAEFQARRYLELAHTDASVFVQGDQAVIVNDLRAEILGGEGVQRVYLSRGDKWTLRKEADGWRIVELVVNRSPR